MLEALPVSEQEDPSAAEWRNLPLEFGKEEKDTPDVDLEKHKD
jgi:hypothetical protein